MSHMADAKLTRSGLPDIDSDLWLTITWVSFDSKKLSREVKSKINGLDTIPAFRAFVGLQGRGEKVSSHDG
jgi:hypothetical protein